MGVLGAGENRVQPFSQRGLELSTIMDPRIGNGDVPSDGLLDPPDSLTVEDSHLHEFRAEL